MQPIRSPQVPDGTPLQSPPGPAALHGVVGVILQADRFLVIRRSQHVRAPGKYCFPGGGILEGEAEEAALQREFLEELNVQVKPLRRLWSSVTPWGVSLVWWHAALPADAQLQPNPLEVESVHWLCADDMLSLPELLESNRHFLSVHSHETIRHG